MLRLSYNFGFRVLHTVILIMTLFILGYIYSGRHTFDYHHFIRKIRKSFRKYRNFKKCKWNTVKDTLVIVGNGLDLNLGLATSYDDFREYYLMNIDKIARNRCWHRHSVVGKDGIRRRITDIELVYGDMNYSVPSGFWSDVELSMGHPQIETLEQYYESSHFKNQRVAKSISNAIKELRYVFCCWIESAKKEQKERGCFGDDCVFLNFNNTETLTDVYEINPFLIYNIHGNALTPKSIVLGHDSFVVKPNKMLLKGDEEDRKVYRACMALYQSSKDTVLNFMKFEVFLAELICEGCIDRVFILGKKIEGVDLNYFELLIKNMISILTDRMPIKDEYRLIENLSMDERDLILCAAATRVFNVFQGIETTKFDNSESEILGYDDLDRIKKFERALIFDQWQADNKVNVRFYSNVITRLSSSSFEQNVRRGQYLHLGDWFKRFTILHNEGCLSKDTKWYVSYYEENEKKEHEQSLLNLGINKENMILVNSIDDLIEMTHKQKYQKCDCLYGKILYGIRYYLRGLLLVGLSFMIASFIMSIIYKLAGPGPGYIQVKLMEWFGKNI